jgi:hypothetical protein
LITAYDLEVGATWQYSISDDNSSVSSNRKFIGICPFYAISNTFICITTIKWVQLGSILLVMIMALLTAQAVHH